MCVSKQHPDKFYEKRQHKNSLGGTLHEQLQTTVPGKEETVTTDEDKLLRRKLKSSGWYNRHTRDQKVLLFPPTKTTLKEQT